MPAAQSPKGQDVSKVAPISVAWRVAALDRSAKAAVARKHLITANIRLARGKERNEPRGQSPKERRAARGASHAPVI